jgi:signal transduction histidine kinase
MRRRLAFLVSATMALVLVAFVVPLAILVRTIAADDAVATATIEAQQVSAEVAATPTKDALQNALQQLAGSGRPVTVFLPGRDPIGAAATRTAAVQLAEKERSSISVSDPGGREILVAVAGVPGGTAVVRTFVTNAELHHGVTRAWLVLAGLGLALLALGVAVAGRLVGTVTRPIGELARVSNRLADGDLEARASLTGPPEVRAVAQSLNHLAGRIRDLIWQERESVADLSHRLRTPLTALRLEAEALAETADPDGRLTAQVQALEDAVTSVIEDARRRSDRPGSCDAAQVIAERAAFWSVLADDQGRQMLVEVAPGPVLVGVAAAELAAGLDALLGNVFAHTPEGAGFAVRLTATAGGGGVLSVRDSGPGFDRDGDPVRRGSSGGGSTGLGLDIARQAAEASGGSLTIQNGPAGAEVVVRLGPPARRPGALAGR